MRQKIRKILLYVSLFLFPVTMNFLSPYVSIDGAFAGVLSGSALMFIVLFLSGVFFGRAWCGWLCPALKAALAILPGDTVKDDRCEFVACGRKVRFSDATQNGAGGQGHGHVVLL